LAVKLEQYVINAARQQWKVETEIHSTRIQSLSLWFVRAMWSASRLTR